MRAGDTRKMDEGAMSQDSTVGIWELGVDYGLL